MNKDLAHPWSANGLGAIAVVLGVFVFEFQIVAMHPYVMRMYAVYAGPDLTGTAYPGPTQFLVLDTPPLVRVGLPCLAVAWLAFSLLVWRKPEALVGHLALLLLCLLMSALYAKSVIAPIEPM
jgi:hypothetical protein